MVQFLLTNEGTLISEESHNVARFLTLFDSRTRQNCHRTSDMWRPAGMQDRQAQSPLPDEPKVMLYGRSGAVRNRSIAGFQTTFPR